MPGVVSVAAVAAVSGRAALPRHPGRKRSELPRHGPRQTRTSARRRRRRRRKAWRRPARSRSLSNQRSARSWFHTGRVRRCCWLCEWLSRCVEAHSHCLPMRRPRVVWKLAPLPPLFSLPLTPPPFPCITCAFTQRRRLAVIWRARGPTMPASLQLRRSCSRRQGAFVGVCVCSVFGCV